jgi:hypothetical protein
MPNEPPRTGHSALAERGFDRSWEEVRIRPSDSTDNFPAKFEAKCPDPDSADDQGGQASLCAYRHPYAPWETYYFRQKRKIKGWRVPYSVATVAVPGSSSVPTVGLTGLPPQRSAVGVWAAEDQGGEYSRKVQQRARICMDTQAHLGTVTCGDGRLWTACLLFASRGSGVRAPLAPLVRSLIRKYKPRIWGKYSSKVQQ